MSNSHSRYDLVSRRSLLKGSLVLGTLAFAPGLACSSSDKDVFATASGTTTTRAAAATSTTGAPPTTTTGKASGATGNTTTTAKPAATGPSIPASSQLTAKFSFTPAAGGGRVNNPFIAVWLEDASGALVRTVSLWYKSSESKYLNELRRWYTDDRAYIAKNAKSSAATVSGATRVAGAYSVVWDGKDQSGALVAQGDYFICIEAAREHGPYELIRQAITLGTTPFDSKLTDNGELTAASVAFVV